MAYKLGLMLSMVFLISVVLLGGDIIAVSSIHSSLDALSLVISRNIGKDGYVSSQSKTLVDDHGARLIYEENRVPAVGESLTFLLQKEYATMVLSKDPLMITVKRTAIVGYYRVNERG